MNIIHKVCFLFIFFIFIFNKNYSQIVKYSNDFLNIGVGARYLSQGNCAVSNVNDATASFWNPAGLMNIESKIDINLMHLELFAGIAKYDYMGTSYKIDNQSNIAFSFIRLGVDDIQNTLNLFDSEGNIDYSRIELFSVSDYSFIISYAKLTKIAGLQIGANTKLIYRHQGRFAKAYGFGIDIGAQYKKGKWIFGAVGKDITTTFNAWFIDFGDYEDVLIETGNELPENDIELTMPRIIIGANREINFATYYSIIPSLDLDFTFDGKRNVLINSNPVSIDPHFGIEFNYKNIYFLRTGINNFQKIPNFEKEELTFQPSLGVGLKIKNFSIDYAITDVGNQTIAPYSNVFSLSYRIK